MQNKSIFQKFLAGLFALMVLASFVFIGYRIATKDEYTAREKEQCRLLSMSAARCAADAAEDNPKIWDLFAEETFAIIIDHRIIDFFVSIPVVVDCLLRPAVVAEAVRGDSGFNPCCSGLSIAAGSRWEVALLDQLFQSLL